VDITAAFQVGRNEILLSGVFARDMEPESIYLIGAFGVRAPRLGREGRLAGQVFDRYAPAFRLTDVADRAQAGEGGAGALVDLTAQALPFFAGRVVLRQALALPAIRERALLEIENVRAAVVRARVNGEEACAVAWDPYRVDVTGSLHAGQNVIELEVVGTRRNLLGPHHVAGGDAERTSPGTFRDKSRWTDDYILLPFGIGPATLRVIAS
jgi:hypothetical protein